MTEPTFGISFLRDDNEPRPAIESDLSVVGLIGPMADANESIPLNDPIAFDSDDTAMLAALGANNLIHDAINGINAQLAEFQQAARIVLVRVAASAAGSKAEKERETIASIVGDSVAGTGIHAFLKAGQKLGVIPRLIAAPGFTHHQPSGDCGRRPLHRPPKGACVLRVRNRPRDRCARSTEKVSDVG